MIKKEIASKYSTIYCKLKASVGQPLKQHMSALLLMLMCGEAAAGQCEYIINSEWSGGFNATIKITNTSESVIDGWKVSWNDSDNSRLLETWNAKFSGSNPYNAENLSWNQKVDPGASIEFGFTGESGVEGNVHPEVVGTVCDSEPPINTPPSAEIEASIVTGVAPLTVDFDGSGSSDLENQSLSFLWDLGDSTSATTSQVSRTYSIPGIYAVNLIVSDGQLEGTDNIQIVVQEENTNPGDEIWRLDAAQSLLHFVSVKKINIVEVHDFESLSGTINDKGEAAVTIDLNSVKTGVDIRDTRMRDLLFQTTAFPSAVVRSTVDLSIVDNLAMGETQVLDLTFQLDLHGVELALSAKINLLRLSGTRIMLQNSSPFLLKAADFDLLEGIEALRTIANLDVISNTIPVDFVLFFDINQTR